LVETANPKQGVFGQLTIDFAICWYVFSISINVMATLAIVGRLLWKRRTINAILGQEHSKAYTGVVTMLVESAAIYSVVGIIFIATYFRRSNAGNLILPFLGNLEVSGKSFYTAVFYLPMVLGNLSSDDYISCSYRARMDT
jgi:hypothetical protein